MICIELSCKHFRYAIGVSCIALCDEGWAKSHIVPPFQRLCTILTAVAEDTKRVQISSSSAFASFIV